MTFPVEKMTTGHRSFPHCRSYRCLPSIGRPRYLACRLAQNAGHRRAGRRKVIGTGLTRADIQPHDHELTSFERAALYHSQRLTRERKRFLDEARERQDRARRNQLRILCLSAAAAFLVSLRALAGNKDEDVAFRSLMKGALLPISVLALLMPVLATAVSGITTFDGDPNVVVRDVRTSRSSNSFTAGLPKTSPAIRPFAG